MNLTLVDQIYDLIHEDLISLKLKPGQRLHIADLAKQYESGPGPIREALSRLLSTELVIALSQRGFRVSAVSQTDLYDVYKTRAHLEALALQLSIEQGGDEWEANMIAAYHRLAKFESEHKVGNLKDYKEWESRHRAFNAAMISACGLNYLLRTQQHFYNLTERYRRTWFVLGSKRAGGLPYAKDQKKIMDAALARDSALATKLLHKHFNLATEMIEACFKKDNLFVKEPTKQTFVSNF